MNRNREKLEVLGHEDTPPGAIPETNRPLASDADEAQRPAQGEERRRPATTLLTRHEGGYAAQGPGFFVWDRDPAEVIRVAESLQAGRFVGSQSARFMVIEQSEAIGA